MVSLGTIGAGIGAASSIFGGILGSSGARRAARLNTENFQAGINDFVNGFGALNDGEDATLTDIDVANEILAGVEPAVLNGLDEQLRIRIAQQVRSNAQQQAAIQQRAAAGGLDASTVGAGLQRSAAFGQSEAIGNIGATFAGQRAGAIAGARGNLARGFQARAGVQQSFASQRANLAAQLASFRSGFQFQAPNTGAAIGQIGGAIGNVVSQIGSEDRFQQALKALGVG